MNATRSKVTASRPDVSQTTGPKMAAEPLKRVETVYPEREAGEVNRRYASFSKELRPSGEVGLILVWRAATLSARMERCVDYETAALTERVRRAIAEFVPPEGADAAEVARLRAEAGTRALFDTSKEAAQARRYEAASERGFFRALKELRLIEKAAKAAEKAAEEDFLDEKLGSFLPPDEFAAEFAAIERDLASTTLRKPAGTVGSGDLGASRGRVDVPFSIGRGR